MNKLINLLMVLLGLLLSSCVTVSHNIGLDRFDDPKEKDKLGVFVLRLMYFPRQSLFDSFSEDESGLTFNSFNSLSFYALRGKKVFCLESLDSKAKNNEAHIKAFEVLPLKSTEGVTYAAGAFYIVGALPAGRYYLSSMTASDELFSYYNTKFSQEEGSRYYVDIQPGVVNYIGDLYWINKGLSESNWFSDDKYSMDLVIQNKWVEAIAFMHSFYPNLLSSVELNIIRSEETMGE